MAVRATASTRAPRGTKTLSQAFFSAADGIPEAQRATVMKAALAVIRDQLKEDREKAKVAKARAKGKVRKTAVVRNAKPVTAAAKKKAIVASTPKRKMRAKPERRVNADAMAEADHEAELE